MTIKPNRQLEFDRIAAHLFAHKARYVAVEKDTGVPWYMIAVLHQRESDANFNTYLGNGEPLSRKTRLVPRGRGPFKTWQEGAVDALHYDGLTTVSDWRLEKILFFCESFNGWGYAMRSLPSPYVWGGTSVQRPGKYVSDGKWNARVMDSQPGCAPILATLAKFDKTIQFTRED